MPEVTFHHGVRCTLLHGDCCDLALQPTIPVSAAKGLGVTPTDLKLLHYGYDKKKLYIHAEVLLLVQRKKAQNQLDQIKRTAARDARMARLPAFVHEVPPDIDVLEDYLHDKHQKPTTPLKHVLQKASLVPAAVAASAILATRCNLLPEARDTVLHYMWLHPEITAIEAANTIMYKKHLLASIDDSLIFSFLVRLDQKALCAAIPAMGAQEAEKSAQLRQTVQNKLSIEGNARKISKKGFHPCVESFARNEQTLEQTSETIMSVYRAVHKRTQRQRELENAMVQAGLELTDERLSYAVHFSQCLKVYLSSTI
jgi:hypothetical protein